MKVAIGIAAAALVGLPFITIIGVAVMAAAITGATTNALTAATVACAYGNPQPQPLLNAMLEVHPVLFRDDIAARFGLEQLNDTGGVAQARMPLVAIGLSLHTVTGGIPATLITWWHGTLPGDNDDTTWTGTHIDNYGTLDTYSGSVRSPWL